MKFFLFLVIATGSLLIVNKLVFPLKQLELFALHKMYQKGSGWDDGATDTFFQYNSRYRDILSYMLDTAEPGSYKEEVAFLFLEMMLQMKDDAFMKKAKDISENHPDQESRCFWMDVLNKRFESVPVNGVKGAFMLVDKGSACDDL